MNLSDRPTLDQALLNEWQHDFPLSEAPFAELAQHCGSDEATVLVSMRRLCREGSISRIGGVWGAGAGGAAMLCALSVPDERLQTVAQLVNAIQGVNHNYEREHHYNLWFVITGRDRQGLHEQLNALEQTIHLRALRLPMVHPYRIDLGFDLRLAARPAHQASPSHTTRQTIAPVAVGEERLAALVEEGLPLIARPYAAWAQALGWPVDQVTHTLSRWLTHGTLRRLGVVVRHHDLGICANAMTVLDVPDHLVDAAGARLASQPGVTLCYRRLRDGDWPYNLYFMVHGHDRASVELIIEQAIQQASLCALPRQSLFSGQRFKQTGGRYFRDPVAATGQEAGHEHAA
ncbi:MAG: Lrp/AsnC family transcriptional regulator [Burkholderiaceae bacterium]|nr:Lrp/AsnC family transcriptional regulator [Burkholderiaceae bacterium]